MKKNTIINAIALLLAGVYFTFLSFPLFKKTKGNKKEKKGEWVESPIMIDE